MSRRPPLAQRLATATRWPVGVLWTSWRYMWRTTVVHRWELTGSWEEDAPPPLPDGVDVTEVQRVGDGAGTHFHRLYRTSIRGSTMSAEALMARLMSDLDAMAPTELASFQRVRGEEGELRVGDEYVVRMPGPWDGPVRVIDRTDRSFRLATLDGHLEAGQIEFRATSSARSIEFVIESWARSGDWLSDVMYSHVRMAKEIQLHMWTSVLERIVKLARGHMRGGIRVVTRRVDPTDSRASRRSLRRLAALRDRPLNLDPARAEEYTRENGWHVDDLTEDLPGEPSGEPVENGSWWVARRLMHDYQVADPGRITAVYEPDAPLAGRDMLLNIRFGPLRLPVGVRVGEPYEEDRIVDDRRARVFGWAYRTLEGHFERGEMHYQVWKWLDDGEVEFRIHAFSQPAASGPLWMRLGFRLIGRGRQLAYYREACRRMRRLTESQLELTDARAREERAAAPR